MSAFIFPYRPAYQPKLLLSALVVLGGIFVAHTASAWSPGTYSSTMPSKNLSVNSADRNDVVAFWHAIYQASEGYEDRIAWTGNYTATNYTTGMGTTSAAFVKDVERRANFFRALCGSTGDVSFNTGATVRINAADANKPAASTTKASANQQSAYMIVRTYMNGSGNGVSHNPPTTNIAWTTAAWNSNARSNLTYGFFGPGAVTAYMRENNAGTSSWNNTVGHRRWILALESSNFATGDTPGEYDISSNSIRPPTNALYVVPNDAELVARTARFITYPCAGYFPAPLNTPYWSLSHPDANFTNATVVMKNSAGQVVSTTKNSSTTAYGDPALVWTVNDAIATDTTIAADLTYTISVTGITGAGLPSSYSYAVTLINPDTITSPQTLTGSAAPPSALQAAYLYTPPTGAEAVQVNVFKNSATAWTENAETAAATIIDRTYGNYTFLSPAVAGSGLISGSKSFRLTHPVRYDLMAQGVPEQIFEISRDILPTAANGTLTFKYKRGYMTAASSLVVESTKDEGAHWTQLGNAITGDGSSPAGSASTWTGTFPASTTPCRVRFRFYKSGGPTDPTYNHQDAGSQPTGIFIDDIATTNCTWLELRKTNDLTGIAKKFLLTAATAGESGSIIPNGAQYHLRMRTKLGNRWFPYGPSKVVTATSTPLTGYDGWVAYEVPDVTQGFSADEDGDGIPNGIECAFNTDPLTPNHVADQVTLPRLADAASGDGKSIPAPAATLSISRTLSSKRDGIDYGAEWSETLAPGSWSSTGVIVTHVTGTITATVPAGNRSRFLRWKIVD